MRRLLLAAAMLGTVSAAHAADMPDLPILRGSFTDGLSKSGVNWQGSYIGAQGGYGSSDENFRGSTSNMMAALLAGVNRPRPTPTTIAPPRARLRLTLCPPAEPPRLVENRNE